MRPVIAVVVLGLAVLLLLVGAAVAPDAKPFLYGAGGCFLVAWMLALLRMRRLNGFLRSLNETVTREDDRHRREMALAAQVHASIIPPSTRSGPFAVEVLYRPLEAVGGDAVEYHVEPERGVLRLAIGDVTGHGVAAALLVNRIHFEAEGLLRQGLPPVETLAALNALACRAFRGTEMLITLAVVEVDLAVGRLRWANAGHPPPLLWRSAARAVSLLTPQAMPLGLADDLAIEPAGESLPIERGDRLVLHTDGLIDILDQAGRRFGMDRLIAAAGEVLGHRAALSTGATPLHADLAQVNTALLHRAEAFARRPAQDDVLVVTVAVEAPEGASAS